MSIDTIYVKLLDEGIDVYRPVKAEKISENIYKILDDSQKAYDEFLEKWEFKTGDIVKCANKQIQKGTEQPKMRMVAFEKKSSGEA